jgi:Icc-related predicted phosphoesterase
VERLRLPDVKLGELGVQGRDCLLEHALVRRRRRAAQVGRGAGPGELERLPAGLSILLGHAQLGPCGLAVALRLFLLGFNLLRFESAGHERILAELCRNASCWKDGMPVVKNMVRIAAIADLHYGKSVTPGSLQPLLAAIADAADLLVICGDLTDYGLPEEARALARELTGALKIPAVAVLGNHDYESGQQDEVRKIIDDAGVVTLDGDSTDVLGIGFAGVKGFAGGFGRHALGPWGEDIIKNFVGEAVSEALKLESALARVRNDHLIAVLHYSPILETVEGEPREILPFLGCSRLEEPLNRFPVTAVFHGHAHHGRPEGRTTKGVPVFNVSLSLMRELSPQQPFRIFEIAMGASSTADHDRRVTGERRTLRRV